MAEKTEFLQAIDDAILDTDSLERFINGSEDETVLTRLSAEYPTLQKALKELFENNGIAKRFKTLAELEISDLVAGDYALVADDTDDANGIYIKEGGVWNKTSYGSENSFLRFLLKTQYVKSKTYGVEYFNSNKEPHPSRADYSQVWVQVKPMQVVEITTEGSFVSNTCFFFTDKARREGFTNLPAPISGTSKLSYIAPNHATSILIYSLTSSSQFSVNVYTKKDDLISANAVYDWESFKALSESGSTTSSSSQYSTAVIPVFEGEFVSGVTPVTVNIPPLIALNKDGSRNFELTKTDDSFEFVVPKGVDRLIVQGINETHSFWSERNRDRFKISKNTLKTSDSQNVANETYVMYETDFSADNDAVGYKSILNKPVSSKRYYYVRVTIKPNSNLPYLVFKDSSGNVLSTLKQETNKSVITQVGEIPDNTATISAYSVQSNNDIYNYELPAVVILSDTSEQLYRSITDTVGIPFYGFEDIGHVVTGSSTYNTSRPIYIAKGTSLYIDVITNGEVAEFVGTDGITEIVPFTSTDYTAPSDGYIRITTVNEGHSKFDPSFKPSYFIFGSNNINSINKNPSLLESDKYLPTISLKCTRDVVFNDGTDRLTIQYLWSDSTGNFYLSSGKYGAKQYIFTFDRKVFHDSLPHHFSMNFDKFGNIICVYRIEQLNTGTYSDDVRKNPIILVKDKGYEPVVVDFGEGKKPSGWLQNCGFICTDDYIMLTEYTRPSVRTANTWKATYPLTDSINWKTVQTFELSPEVSPADNLKHIHNVNRDPYTGFIYTTTGDTSAGAAMYVSKDDGETFTKILGDSEKYCRTLNFVFDRDYIYWATDSSGSLHWFFKAPRKSDGVLDVDSIVDVIMFPTDSAPTYACIYMRSLNIILFLGRHDSAKTSVPIDLWDFKTEQMVRLDVLPSVGGIPNSIGFRCECFEYYPRGNELICGFSERLGGGGYRNRIGILGNTTETNNTVNNIVLNINRLDDSFKVTYSTVV